MAFGVGYFPTCDGMDPGSLARMLEERGQDAVYFSEHTHIPASRQSPSPEGATLPRKHWHCYDLFVALTAAAAATSTLRVCSGICLVIERDPIITANEVASVDHLSGGRFEFGVGAGWNRQEMRNHGTDPRRRMKLLRERDRRVHRRMTERSLCRQSEGCPQRVATSWASRRSTWLSGTCMSPTSSGQRIATQLGGLL
jgi:alkanesulfonate monooxygenase SsuD/methylene tetrahydromethanopterin reductase-like flavin-dependent oxidoreductase (luciferase family)